MKSFALFFALVIATPVFCSAQQGQSVPDVSNRQNAKNQKSKKQSKGAVSEVGSGIGSTAAGAGKGAGHAAEGVGKGALDLATLHPIKSGEDIGTGAVRAGKDVTVGTAKGVGKVGKGIGHAIKGIF